MDFSTIFDILRTTLLAMGIAVVTDLPRLVAAAILVALAFPLARLVRWIVLRAIARSRQHRPAHQSLVIAIGRLSFASAVAIFVLVAATVAVPSFSIGGLIQLLGVGGVVIGFAFSNILQNFLAGILLLITEPFTIGDQIVVDSFEGTVEQIQARATYIRTYDRRRIVVPNSDLFTKSVTVNTAFAERRVIYDLVLKGEVDPTAAKERISGVLRGIEGVRPDPVADALLTKIGGDTVTLHLLFWCASERAEFLKTQDRVLTAIRQSVRDAGWAIA